MRHQILSGVLSLAFCAAISSAAMAQRSTYRDFTAGNTQQALADRAALHNAQKLVVLLSKGREVEGEYLFFQATNAFYQAFSNTLTDKLRELLGMLEKADALPERLRLLKNLLEGLNVATVTSGAANALLKYQLATTPNKITAFYAEAAGATKVSEVPGKATDWLIKHNVPYRLTFKVSVHIPGSNGIKSLGYDGSVITPAGITEHILQSIVPDPLIPIPLVNEGLGVVREYLRPRMRDVVRTALQAASDVLRPKHILDYGFRYTDAWLNTNALTAKINADELAEVEIGNVFTVALSASHPSGVLDTTPLMLSHMVRGVAAGKQAGFYASFTQEYASLGQHGGQPLTRWMWFRVIDDEDHKRRSPDVATPMPVWRPGQPAAPVLAPPSLGQLPPPKLPPVPKAPPIPKLPPVPAQPGASSPPYICVQDAAGHWNYPDKCEPH